MLKKTPHIQIWHLIYVSIIDQWERIVSSINSAAIGLSQWKKKKNIYITPILTNPFLNDYIRIGKDKFSRD